MFVEPLEHPFLSKKTPSWKKSNQSAYHPRLLAFTILPLDPPLHVAAARALRVYSGTLEALKKTLSCRSRGPPEALPGYGSACAASLRRTRAGSLYVDSPSTGSHSPKTGTAWPTSETVQCVRY